MEMIDRREVFDSRSPGIDPSPFHGFQDSCKDVTLTPMVGNGLSVCHVWPSSFTVPEYHSLLAVSRWIQKVHSGLEADLRYFQRPLIPPDNTA